MKPSFNQAIIYSVLPFTLLLLIFSCSETSENQLLKQEKSLHQKKLERCIGTSYKEKEWETFNICRKEHSNLARQINDSSAYAKNLFYAGLYFYDISIPDSSYSNYVKSLRIYRQLKNTDEIGRLLLNIAILEKEVADYKGSESTSFEALDYLSKGEHKDKQSAVYNNLGLIYNQLKDTSNALKYHHKALTFKQERGAKPSAIIASLNNIGKIYKDYQQYGKAIEYFKLGLDFDSILNKNLKDKAILLDNYGYCRFKNGEQTIGFQLMNEALKIRTEERLLKGIAVNNIHLAEYYAETNDTITAIKHAEKAEGISKKTKDYGDYKIALNLLSNLHSGRKSKEYYKKHNLIRDSLELVARKQKEQFGRIKFEINEKEQHFIKTKQHIIVFGVALCLLLIGIYLYRQWKKRKLAKAFEAGFKSYLVKKYKLTTQNIEFWELWITGMDQAQMSETLFISIDAIKSRRKSLREKIDKIQNIDGNFTQTKAIHIYNLERDVFRNFN